MTKVPALMGATEIGRAVRRSKQRVNGIVDDPKLAFPKPVVTYLARTRLWLEADVRAWVAGRGAELGYAWHEWKLDDGT